MDDLLIFANDNELKIGVKQKLMKSFKMKDLGEAVLVLKLFGEIIKLC